MLKKLLDWLDERTHVKDLYREQMIDYKVPKNLTFPYVFGVLALITFVIQIVSGVILIMYYKPVMAHAFDSANYTIMKEISFGWLFRHIHAAGANFFLAIVYLHMFTGIYYNAYKKPRELVWIVGWVIYFTLLTTALTGYLLPWGQLSYWGTVVTTEIPASLADAPILKGIFTAIGETISIWMKGGYKLEDLALGRFFGLHVLLLPLILLGLVSIHLFLVRAAGISNPEGYEIDKKSEPEKLAPFHPYITLKEGAIAMWYLALFFFFVFFNMSHFLPADNFEPADPLKTPPHIAPEWYLLGFYEVFRSIPSKFWGFVAFNLILILLLLLPVLDFSPLKSARRRPLFFVMFLVFLFSSMILTVLGTMAPTPTNAQLGMFFTFLVFLFFLSLPVISFLEWGWYRARGGKS